MDFVYICGDCTTEYPSSSIIYRCPRCDEKQHPGEMQRGNLKTFLDPDYLSSLKNRPHVSPGDFLPYPVPHESTYPVGNTPLTAPKNLIEKYGFPKLLLKNEGANPSGSFKDRASQLVAAQALHFGENTIALASTGNAGSAMACAGAAYGLNIVLFVPETAPAAKLMQSVLYGARVIPIKGSYDTAFGLSIEFTRQFGGINRNTAYNPMTTEGKKTVSIEIFNQLGRTIPDTVYIPVGDGVIFSGVHKGFADLAAAGLIAGVPKLVCCQSTKSNAISQAWKTGTMGVLGEAATRADSISVASPANGRMAVEYIKASGGWATEIADEEILDAQLELAKDAGLFAEPAAAAAWAGFRRDVLEGRIRKDERVLVLLTGTGFKDMKVFDGTVAIPDPVEPTMDAVSKLFI